MTERERREDARFGMLASILANANRDSKTRPEPFQPADFFPSLGDQSVPVSRETAEPDDLRIARSMASWGQRGRNIYRANLGLPPTG